MIRNAQWETVEYKVTPDQWLKSQRAGQSLTDHRRGAPSGRILKANHHAFAYLGEGFLHKWLREETDVVFEWSGWDLRTKGDDFDFRIGGALVDVKTRATNWRQLDILDFPVILDDPEQGKGNQLQKPMDYYVFALWRPHDMKVNLLGWSTKELFMAAPSNRFVDKGETLYGPVTANQPVYLVKVRDLEPMLSFPLNF